MKPPRFLSLLLLLLMPRLGFGIAAGVAVAMIIAPRPAFSDDEAGKLRRIRYNHPGLAVDLGVGLWAWPVPIDHDNDGDYDLIVVCPDKPCNGAWLFENPGSSASGGDSRFPVFKPGKRLGKGDFNIMPSYVDGRVRVLGPGLEYPDFGKTGLATSVRLGLPTNVHPNRLRANQWRLADYDGDGKTDVVVGAEDWTDYGWDNAFDKSGKWTRGPLHGLVYWLRNLGEADGGRTRYDKAVPVQADGKTIDGFGMPSPNFADFDGDGDLDLLCGDFLGRFSYYRNVGDRSRPVYEARRDLGIEMDLEMIVPVALDWDKDGDIDLVVGQEDGRVALIEHTGRVEDGAPRFAPPRFFRQEADEVKFGALATPVGFDWDGDGDEDLICGNTAGYIGWIENLGSNPPKWDAPRYLKADDAVIRIQAGPNGSIQGPAEARWGYTTFSVADWDGDELPDIVTNSIVGQVVWFRNVGSRTAPRLAAAQPVQAEWPGTPPKPAWNWRDPAPGELWTQWRTTPLVVDWNYDKLADLVMLDHEGYLAFYERAQRDGRLVLKPGRRIFRGSSFDRDGKAVGATEGGALRLNADVAGRSGRRKLCLADWDGDGRLDLLVNSRNVNILKNVGESEGVTTFADQGLVDPRILAGHDTSPTTVDWDKNGTRDLLIGAEDGFFYHLENPRSNRSR